MSSLKEAIVTLEDDLRASPRNVGVYRTLPFAVLRYDPELEWECRREIRLLKARLETGSIKVHLVCLDQLLWRAIESTEGIEAVVELERRAGFEAAQKQVGVYLSDPDLSPLPDMVAEELDGLDPSKDVAFLIHAGAMSPGIFRMSQLLDRLHGKTLMTSVLWYPGIRRREAGLAFMGLEDRTAIGDYKVKVYG